MIQRTKEVRATDPTTGAQKGRKEQQLGLIPWESVWQISEVYAYGAQKYAAHNWRGGYAWSWSFDALLRHLTAWWSGENTDPESGKSHLAHAGFHILSLMWFQLTGRGTDDRWRPAESTAPGTAERQVSAETPVGDAKDLGRGCCMGYYEEWPETHGPELAQRRFETGDELLVYGLGIPRRKELK